MGHKGGPGGVGAPGNRAGSGGPRGQRRLGRGVAQAPLPLVKEVALGDRVPGPFGLKEGGTNFNEKGPWVWGPHGYLASKMGAHYLMKKGPEDGVPGPKKGHRERGHTPPLPLQKTGSGGGWP